MARAKSGVEAAARRFSAEKSGGDAASTWQRRACALAKVFPLARLHPAALAAAPAGAWGVGFSGGPDSLTLLLLLWAHFPGRRRSLGALHFDHGLRGAASRADAAFSAKVCRALEIKFASAAWKRPRGAKRPSEAEAREARLHFFSAACARRRITALWLGHQQDDIAETMLMRLARGSGTAGLAAPRPAGDHHPIRLRPLLTLKKRELLTTLAELEIPFRQDRTNAGNDYFRNRVRARVIPEWLASGPERDGLAGAALSRDLLEEDDAALEALTTLCRPLTPSGRLDLRKLQGRPRAIWRRALHRWVLAQNARKRPFRLSRAGFGLLLAAVERGEATRMSLGASTFACIDGGKLFLARG